MIPSKRMCPCGRVSVHRVNPKCQWPKPWRINPAWRRWQATVIRRQFKAGRSLPSLDRQFGRRIVWRAIQNGLRASVVGRKRR